MSSTTQQNLDYDNTDVHPAGMTLSRYISQLWQQTEKVGQNP
ncbi:hypothetical protein [uncultured Alteromonas sp.]|nr:hypothetical protein [uncultured Alteromonas sp.]